MSFITRRQYRQLLSPATPPRRGRAASMRQGISASLKRQLISPQSAPVKAIYYRSARRLSSCHTLFLGELINISALIGIFDAPGNRCKTRRQSIYTYLLSLPQQPHSADEGDRLFLRRYAFLFISDTRNCASKSKHLRCTGRSKNTPSHHAVRAALPSGCTRSRARFVAYRLSLPAV